MEELDSKKEPDGLSLFGFSTDSDSQRLSTILLGCFRKMMNRIVTRKRSLLQATSTDESNVMGDPSFVQVISDGGVMNLLSSDNGFNISSSSESSPKKIAPCYDSDSGYSSQRAGKWSTEEENLANQLVIDFENGALEDCDDGTTLRSYLARKLNCAPMRISKKFAGRCIGKVC